MKNIFNLSKLNLTKTAQKKPKVLVVSIEGMIEDKDLKPINEVADVELVISKPVSEQKLAQMCRGFDHLMLNMDVVEQKGDYKLTKAFYSNSGTSELKSLLVDMTGLDYFTPSEAEAAGVRLMQTDGYSTRSVAETILCEILLHSRNRHLAYKDLLKGKKQKTRKGINLLNKTAGIVGYGNIGSEVAEILRGLGMNILVWNYTPIPGIENTPLPKLFSDSDVICISMKTVAKGKDANVGMINGDLLNNCKGAIIINLANYILVDNWDMLKALNNGNVRGYSIYEIQGSATEGHQEKAIKKMSENDNFHMCPADGWDSDESRALLKERWVKNMLDVLSSEQGGHEKEAKCWVGYKAIGMKKKKGKLVPNCVRKGA
jgi:lactate dehydrogenase-like 2-hydroxyacid dehydrogenase